MKKQLLTLSLLAILGTTAFAAHWDYSEKNGPSHWEGICHTGKNQAPIDIKNAISTDDLPAVTFNYADKTTGFVVNNGHSIQFNLKKPETIKLGDHTLELVQLH